MYNTKLNVTKMIKISTKFRSLITYVIHTSFSMYPFDDDEVVK